MTSRLGILKFALCCQSADMGMDLHHAEQHDIAQEVLVSFGNTVDMNLMGDAGALPSSALGK